MLGGLQGVIMFGFQGPVINHGEGGGGYRIGKIAGPKLVIPHSKQDKTFCALPF